MILIAYGTRPEWIKIKPLINHFKKEKISFKVLFTGQHKDIALGNPDYNYEMVEMSTNRLDSILKNCLSIPNEYFEKITHILVQGDTTTALGLSIYAFHRKIKIIHLEAGLRTYDFDNPYPEEANRQMISRLSEINLCPTILNKQNLLNEGISDKKTYVVGNTVLDNLIDYKSGCEYTNKVLITLHRRENHNKIEDWFRAINELSKNHRDIEFIMPMHPNPNVIKYKHILTNINVVSPLSHEELLNLLVKTKLVITDSGGLQEECSFFNKKCLVCRETTERPESIGTTTFLVQNPTSLIDTFNNHIKNYEVNSTSPFGDGYSSEKITNILKEIL